MKTLNQWTATTTSTQQLIAVLVIAICLLLAAEIATRTDARHNAILADQVQTFASSFNMHAYVDERMQ